MRLDYRFAARTSTAALVRRPHDTAGARDDPAVVPSLVRPDAEDHRPRFAEVLVLIPLCLLLYWGGNHWVAFFDRDEPRYAQATREMLARGDWIVPTFNGEYRFHKPVLIYWLMALAYAVLGEGEFAARFFSGVFGTLSVLITYRLGTTMFGRGAGRWSAVVLATMPLFCLESKLATPDAMLVAFVGGAFFQLWHLLPCEHRVGTGFGRAMGFWSLLGLSFLAKGPAGMAIVFVSLGTWSLLRGGAIAKRLHWRWGIPVFLVITLPWYGAVTWRSEGEFLRFALGTQVLKRMAAPLEGHHGFPGIYLASLLLTLGPWASLIVPALRQRYRSHQAARNPQVAVASAWPPFIRHCRILVDAWTADARYAFLAAWIVAPLVLLEPLQTRLVHYYLPAYPAWALLLGAFLAGLASRRGPARAGCAAFGYEMLAGYGVLGLLAAAAALLSLPRPLGPPLALTVAVGGSLCSAAWIALRRRHLRLGAVLLGTATASLCASAAWWVIPAAGPLRLAQHVAERMRWHAGTGPTVLFGFEEPSVIYYLGGDIPTPATPQQLEERLRRTGPAISALPPPVVEALRESGLFDIQRLEVVSGYDLNKGRCQQVQIVRIALPNTGA